jgi:hypothetical protein
MMHPQAALAQLACACSTKQICKGPRRSKSAQEGFGSSRKHDYVHTLRRKQHWVQISFVCSSLADMLAYS